MSLDSATRSAIEAFLSQPEDGQPDADTVIRHDGDVSLWELLCGIADRREIAFHGTGDPNIESFEPRRPIDFAPFGHQKAVLATSDPIWAMFYAIVDRARYPITERLAHVRPDARPKAAPPSGKRSGRGMNGPAWTRTRDRRIMSPLL